MRPVLVLVVLALAGCAEPAGEPMPHVRLPPGDAIFRAGVHVTLDDPRPPPTPGDEFEMARTEFVAGECRALTVGVSLKLDQPPVEATLGFESSADGGGPGGLVVTFEPTSLHLAPGARANSTMTVCAADRVGEVGHATVGAAVQPEVGSVSRGLLTRIVAP